MYRYFPSRDELLTALIVEAYDALGAAAEEAAEKAARDEPAGAAARGLRRGPRLGAGAPARVRAGLRLAGARLRGAAGHDRTGGPGRGGAQPDRGGRVAAGVVDPGTGGADAALAPGAAEAVGLPVDPDATVGARVVQVWTALFGLISFEVFGQLHNVVERREEFFHDAVERLGDLLGLPPR